MIKLRNEAEKTLTFKKSGSAAVANNVDYAVVPFDGYIKSIKAGFAQPGVDGTGAPTQDVRVDIKKNGASIFASAAASIIFAHANIATNNLAPVINSPSTDPTKVSKNDVLRADILQILNGTSPTQPLDLFIEVVIARARVSPSPTIKGSLSEID